MANKTTAATAAATPCLKCTRVEPVSKPGTKLGSEPAGTTQYTIAAARQTSPKIIKMVRMVELLLGKLRRAGWRDGRYGANFYSPARRLTMPCTRRIPHEPSAMACSGPSDRSMLSLLWEVTKKREEKMSG